MASAGDIRVFVKWHEHTVFAGEEVRCTITFRNVASASASAPTHLAPQRTPRQVSGGVRTTSKLQPPTTPRGHRSVASSPRIGGPGPGPGPLQAGVAEGEGEGRGHRKSVSIVSLGGGVGEGEWEGHAERLSRFNRGHGRASSLQIASFPAELGGTQSGMFVRFLPGL